MKKVYVIPTTNKVEVKIESLLVNYSNSQAASDAAVFSREGGDRGGFLDDDED